MRSNSHLDADLASTHVEAALEALNVMRKLSNKVKSAHVHAKGLDNGPITYGRVQFDMSHLLRVFETLGSLPNLQSLTVELNYHVLTLPVTALITVLKGKQLKKLHLKHLQLVGCGQEFDELDALLKEQTQLEVLTLDCCRGVSAVRSLVQQPPALKEIRIINTALAPYGTLNKDILAQFVTPTLEILKLDDVPELEDCHIQALALKLAAPDATLREFHLLSNMLTEKTGIAITEVLATNTSLKKLTLHLDAEKIVSSMAQVLSSNTTLQWLDMRMYNDNRKALTNDAKCLARALTYNTSLLHLRLRLEIELHTLPVSFLDAFKASLEVNQTLTSIRLEDGAYCFPLPRPMELQLKLNEARIPFLLKQVNAQSQLAEALIQSSSRASQSTKAACDDMACLDMIYHILSNSPALVVNATADTANVGPEPVVKEQQISKQQQLQVAGKDVPALHIRKISDWKFPSLSKTLKRRSFTKRQILAVARTA